jgi:hypothetical protein
MYTDIRILLPTSGNKGSGYDFAFDNRTGYQSFCQ